MPRLPWRKIIAGTTLGGMLLPFFAFAADIPLDVSIKILGRKQFTDMADYIGVVYQYLAGIAGVLAVVMIMYGGMKWIFSAGDSSKISSAKETITHAVIGLLLALGSFLILNTINPNLVRLKVPDIKTIPALPLGAMGECPDEATYQGKYACGDIYEIKQNKELKEYWENVNPQQVACRGVSCQTGGCWNTTQVKPTAKHLSYVCVDRTNCGLTCGDITIASVGDAKTAQELCDSDACVGVTNQRCWWEGSVCAPRIKTGDKCNKDYTPALCAGANGNPCPNLQCADVDAVCDGAVGKCITQGTLVAGAKCTNPAACQSGKCEGGASKIGVLGSYAAGSFAGGAVAGYVLTGTAIGSVFPGVGTAVGAAAGLGIAGGYYLYAEYFSDGTCQ